MLPVVTFRNKKVPLNLDNTLWLCCHLIKDQKNDRVTFILLQRAIEYFKRTKEKSVLRKFQESILCEQYLRCMGEIRHNLSLKTSPDLHEQTEIDRIIGICDELEIMKVELFIITE